MIFKKTTDALGKELQQIEKQEQKLKNAALKAKPSGWKAQLESKIPEKVYEGLESAFCKGFSVVFSKGRPIIEKSYKKEKMIIDYAIRDYAVLKKGGKRELKQMRKCASHTTTLNMAITTVEGVGLGALGIGMPDIVLFLSTLLKGVYETALNYGFEYESPKEQIFILKMMEASLCSGMDWWRLNEQVDGMMNTSDLSGDRGGISEDDLEKQIKETASAFAVDMLLLKFIQGLPVVGVIGGAANPVYYNKVIKYVQLKYRKRYLLKKITVYRHL